MKSDRDRPFSLILPSTPLSHCTVHPSVLLHHTSVHSKDNKGVRDRWREIESNLVLRQDACLLFSWRGADSEKVGLLGWCSGSLNPRMLADIVACGSVLYGASHIAWVLIILRERIYAFCVDVGLTQP